VIRLSSSIRWFALVVPILVLALPLAASSAPPAQTWSSWHTSRIVRDHGYPVFTVDGKPFFIYGAAFFYERVPRNRWKAALLAYRRLGINTIDLYAIWNWHQPVDAPPDFTGVTNSRRDLVGLLEIIHALGLRVILRPGPVIRNEWRNGGYPDWLLTRPEYNMPLRDVLEGRYPATATLQNAHADAAAAEWLANTTHCRRAAQWLREVLHAVAPYAHDIIAVALDDDQGAYLDNDTWPAPHWHAYIDWLRSVIVSTAGRNVPLFVNTFEMKVPAASPVWAWGNWYQSNAYSIGAHDLSELDFATGLLQTQTEQPVMQSEFQAGWLQGADEGAPRPADPANTVLALHELLRDGAHGIVNFPLQDTIYPDGWEVPWANWSYAWDAALTVDLAASPRYAPTGAFGAEVARYGPLLARTHPALDAEIIWPPSLFAPRGLTDADFASFADATIAAQQQCRAREMTCGLIDLAQPSVDPSAKLILPILLTSHLRMLLLPRMHQTLLALATAGRLVSDPSRVPLKHAARAPDGTRLVADDGRYAFFDVVNPSESARSTPMGTIPPRSARLFLFQAPSALRRMSAVRKKGAEGPLSAQPPLASPPPLRDPDGLVLSNGVVRLVLAPNAGARIAELHYGLGTNAASSVGLLRDAVEPAPSPSSRDYIAAYTHPLPAGTFNRTYVCSRSDDAHTSRLACAYDAPDLPEGGARFERTLTLDAASDEVAIDERMISRDPSSAARLESVSGFAFGLDDTLSNGPGWLSIGHAGQTTTLRWIPAEVTRVDLRRTRGAEIVTLVFATPEVHFRLQQNRP
jgi:hypothetical protein